MRKLASNLKAALFKCGNEYWVVAYNRNTRANTPDNYWEPGCYEEQSDRYNATTALGHFEGDYGKASWIHPDIAQH